jgi:3-hydroxyacyl-[acyl-carrier-protein] dehydratase
MRYFLIDRVTEFVPGERARGVKAVSLSDEVLHDHFPDHPVMPGLLILEGAAQLAGFLLEATVNREDAPPRRAVLVQVRNAKFHAFAGPGDLLEFTVAVESILGDAGQVKADVTVAGRRVARADLTFVMMAIESERVHEQRRYLYSLWTRDMKPPPAIR